MTASQNPRETTIIATLGPSSSSFEQIEALYLAGADFFRLNFSHGSHEDHKQRMIHIHDLRVRYSVPIGVLADLQGPKLRIGTFAEGKIALKPGQIIQFDSNPAPGDETRVCLPHADVLGALAPGMRFMLNDGNVEMRVKEKGDGLIMAEVVSGTELSNKKGLNLPELARPIAALTDKDKADLDFALALGVDWVALSFVQTADDVMQARAFMGNRARLMAKIEKPSALHNIGAIIEAADGIMVARGDLGVETPFEHVPGVQRLLVHMTRAAGKPVVVATQMLESMIGNPRATRAEISDISTAVKQGTTAVMLSGETASGKYPVEAVKAMDAVCRSTELQMRDPATFLKAVFTRTVADPAMPLGYNHYTPSRLTTWHDLRASGAPVPQNLGLALASR